MDRLKKRERKHSPTINRNRRLSSYCAPILLLFAFPLFHFLFVDRAPATPNQASLLESIDRNVPPGSPIMTDDPPFISWETGRRTVWLPVVEADWDALEKAAGSIDAVWVSPSLFRDFPHAGKHWWAWLALPRGTVRGLHPVPLPPENGLLRVRKGALK